VQVPHTGTCTLRLPARQHRRIEETMQDITYDIPVLRRPRRWPWLLAATVSVAAGAGITAAVLLTGSGPAPVSGACQKATVAQNRFVAEAVALGYPDVPVTQGLSIISADLKLLHDMTTAGCPGTTLVDTLPG